MTVVGLSGFAQSGKTTAALYLEKKYGIRRKHIAEPLRAMLAVLLQANGMSSEMISRYLEGDLKEKLIPELGVTSRYAQITIGTEWGRELINPDLWANTWGRGIADGESVMNDSVRFPNEETPIHEAGGFTILIKRPGTRPANFKWGKIGAFLYDKFGLMWGVHDSERTDRLHPDFVIHNDSTVEQLYADIDAAMQAWEEHGRSGTKTIARGYGYSFATMALSQI
ncbi:MAG: putative deoxynucleotide monophosphate kinase [Bradyrhizobium sp.]|nr:putative deoxynucleotide monophosphate kinase [Bradyrhizobium sp.]